MSAPSKKEISEDLLLKIERITSGYKSNAGSIEPNGIKVTSRLNGSSTSRPKTPETNVKKHPFYVNRESRIDDTRMYKTENFNNPNKFRGLRYSHLENMKKSNSRITMKQVRNSTIDTLGVENKHPNKIEWDINSSRELIDLLNKEKEVSSYLKAELQKTCLESRKEKAELQKKIYELSKGNAECYKQIANEKSNSRQAWSTNKILSKRFESISSQTRMLVSGLVEVIDEVAKQVMDAKVKDSIKQLVINKLEKVNTVEGGIFFSDELRKIKAKKLLLSNIQPKEDVKCYNEVKINEEYQPVRIEKLNANLHKGSEVFGTLLPEITISEIANDVDDHSSLLRTIKNINEEFDDIEEEIDSSPEKVPAIPRKCPGIPTNSLKELEELKARLSVNKRKLACNK
jgi:hypothetical protein